jgi:multiple sugar transport system permease protein
VTSLTTSTNARSRRQPARRRSVAGQSWMAWGFMSPAMALLLLMTVVPTLYLVYFAFRHEDLLGPNSHWAGFDNFRRVLTDANIGWDALTTLQFVVLAVSIEMLLGLVLALMLSRKLAETNLVTALVILPLGVAPVVSALVFRVLLDPAYGWVDYYLQSWGVIDQPIDWFGEPVYAWIAVIGLDVWQWTPFVALILLAGLQGVPSEPKEAARLDGANAWQTFWHIVLPFMTPFLAIALVFRTIEAFKTFGSVFVLTGGGPGTSTSLVNLDLYRIALQNFDVGAAAALGICFLVVLSAIMGRLLAVLNRNTDILED